VKRIQLEQCLERGVKVPAQFGFGFIHQLLTSWTKPNQTTIKYLPSTATQPASHNRLHPSPPQRHNHLNQLFNQLHNRL